ncbi:MAG: serine/threonine-protein kinase [Isosphaeraceae bacterium]|nr:serine/threonine-protein kinase [Isosphaeraceae bacterium]
MATPEKSKGPESVPSDLLPLIRASGVWNDRQLAEVKAKILAGDYPIGTYALADRLIQDKLLTEYQAKRLLAGKTAGLSIGKYVVLDRIGSGAMGRVYKAYHSLMGRVVAVKVISPEYASNERAVARFQREMKLVGRLDHPNVVRAYDADSDRGVLYIVMEYVHGRSLGQILAAEGPLPPVDVVNYAAQAALGLGHAHQQGVVHRDVKPSNLLVNDEKQLKVLDLGLGVLMDADAGATFATADGIAVGTVDYMSPEQACGRTVDGRSDLYNLGCAMYHLIAGKQAFPGSTPIERLGKRINGRPTPITEHRPDLPSSLVNVLDKLLANNPNDRYQRAEDAAEALQALIRPRKNVVKASARGSEARANSSEASPTPAAAQAGAATNAVPERVIEIRSPEYPHWFRPIARLAERRPRAALAALAILPAIGFIAGFVLGRIARG